MKYIYFSLDGDNVFIFYTYVRVNSDFYLVYLQYLHALGRERKWRHDDGSFNVDILIAIAGKKNK